MTETDMAMSQGTMDPKSMRDLEAAMANMARSLKAYVEGDEYAYLPVAVELRKLLCDDGPNGDQSLVLRIHAAIAFHRLRVDPGWIDEHTTFCIPALVTVGGRQRGLVSRLFTDQNIPLPLAEWRQQPLLSRAITIRNLIRSVADKEAAHSDFALNPTLSLAKSAHLAGPATSDAEMIAAIGQYMLTNLLMRRILDLRADVVPYYMSERSKHGKGAVRLAIGDANRPYSQGLPLTFFSVAEMRRETSLTVADREKVAGLVESRDDADCFWAFMDGLVTGGDLALLRAR